MEEGGAMAEYTFDGKRLKKVSTGAKLGEVEKNLVRAVNGALLGDIERKSLRDNRGKKVAEFDGKVLKDDRGGTIASIKDIAAVIDGTQGIEMAALWYFFVRK
jgi:hypothetical protein